MNKLNMILILGLAMITSACAGNALAQEGSAPLKDIDAEEISDNRLDAIDYAHLELPQSIWSGDDYYDPAAGAELEGFQSPSFNYTRGGFSGDDIYDPAARTELERIPVHSNSYSSGGFSGDDAYDLAAGAELEIIQLISSDSDEFNGGYSGDDAYDPAAGAELGSLPVRSKNYSSGGFSGDDPYDPAARDLG